MRSCLAALTVVAVLLFGGSCALFSLPDSGFEVGNAFPTLYLPSLADGKPQSIADYRGEKVILHVFASW
jgi:hypothetical protein